jgi:hypothetical protein
MSITRSVEADYAAIKRAFLNYSFGFTLHGVACRSWFDPETDEACFDCDDTAEGLFHLAQDLERLIDKSDLLSRVDLLELRKYLCKHLQAMIKVERELHRSKRRYELLNSKLKK